MDWFSCHHCIQDLELDITDSCGWEEEEEGRGRGGGEVEGGGGKRGGGGGGGGVRRGRRGEKEEGMALLTFITERSLSGSPLKALNNGVFH